ncbi:MAG: RlmE family RNA methyltransferase [Alphaproteobacteria bacterium]|nr:RlmE family RNA methyltransferase [Alphaproteobacteria bacterium]
MSRAGRPPPGRQLRERLRTARSRTPSSQRWLERQLNDPYVAAARHQGYRSRAAWKLEQMDDRYRLIPRGGRVVDLGAAPGGWTQVAIERTGPGGRVLAVDINEMEPLAGAEVMQLDFTAEGADEIVRARLDGPVDLVLSDMAQPATGHRQTDHIRIMLLCELALDFALGVLKPGGAFVAKVLKGGTENELLLRMKQHFAAVRHAKPDASRKDSAEAYVVAIGFKG